MFLVKESMGKRSMETNQTLDGRLIENTDLRKFRSNVNISKKYLDLLIKNSRNLMTNQG